MPYGILRKEKGGKSNGQEAQDEKDPSKCSHRAVRYSRVCKEASEDNRRGNGSSPSEEKEEIVALCSL